MVIEHQFFQLLWQIVIEHDSLTQEQSTELHNKLVDLVMHDEVSPTVVVQSFAYVFAQVPSRYLGIILTMDAIYTTSQMKGGYPYPEFFWIIEQNGVFSKIDDITDIIWHASKFCDRDILRAHLSFLLMMSESRHQKNIIFAFYYVGHTVETLKLVLEIMPVNEGNLDLYNYVYSNAMAFLYSPRSATLTMEDKTWLQEFFTRGLLLEHGHITESCQTALEKLTEG